MSSEFPKKTEADLRRPGLYQLPQLAKVTLLSYWISIVVDKGTWNSNWWQITAIMPSQARLESGDDGAPS